MPQPYSTNQSGAIYIPGYGWMSQTDYNSLNIEPMALSQPASGFEPPSGSWTSPPPPVNISPNEWALPNYPGNYYTSPSPNNFAPPDSGGLPTGFASVPYNTPPTEGGGYPFDLPGTYNPAPNEDMFPTPIADTGGAPGSITDIPGGNIPLSDIPSDQPSDVPVARGYPAPPAPEGIYDLVPPPSTPNNFFGGIADIFTNDPTPGIAPSGFPVGSHTPDAVFRNGPLAGSFAGLGSGGGGTLSGGIGSAVGWALLRHALASPAGASQLLQWQRYQGNATGQKPTFTYNQAMKNWAYWAQHGLPNPGAASQPTSAGNVGSSGRATSPT